MSVRSATVEDALAVETVRIRGWQAAYRGIVPDSFLDSLVIDTQRRARLMGSADVTTLVAGDDEVVGMAVYGPARDDDGVVELYALYVDPSAWRTGVGAALLAACEGVTVLWVLADNERAQAFYKRYGFAVDGASRVLDLDGPVTEIRMRRG
ncbi:MAG: N-acetyltransferase family protein [Mycobacteriales bacterium]